MSHHCVVGFAVCCVLYTFSSAHPRSPPLLRLCSPPRGLLSLSSLAAVAVVSPSARGVASGTAAAALLLRLLGEGALRCYFFFLSKKRGFFFSGFASGRLRSPPGLRSPPVASGRLRSPPVAFGRPRSPGACLMGVVLVRVLPGSVWFGSVARSQLGNAFVY